MYNAHPLTLCTYIVNSGEEFFFWYKNKINKKLKILHKQKKSSNERILGENVDS